MTTEEIRAKIFGHITASWGTITPISLPNFDFIAPQGSWIRPVIKIPSTMVGELGADGVALRDGLLMISVFTKSGIGTKTASSLADRLEGFFRRRDLDNLWFDEPNSNPVGNDDNGYYHILMTCDFHCWVGESK